MAQTIQFRRGNEVNLPSLAPGEPAVTLDTEKVFVGSPNGNLEVPTTEVTNGLDSRLTQNTEQLGDVTYNVKPSGAIGDGVIDDTVALNNAFASCPKNGKLTFEKNKTYRITNKLSRIAPIEIDLNGSTLVMSAPDNTTAISISKLKHTHSGISIPIDSYTPSFIIPTDVTVQKGDLVKLWNSTSYTTRVNYYRGYIGEVLKVVGDKAYLRSLPEYTFTATNMTIHEGINGVRIKNGTIDVSQTPFGHGISVTGLNINISNVKVIGADHCSQGIVAIGENIRVEGCDVDGFTNSNGMYGGGGRLGYGVNVSGRNIVVDGNNIVNCKHCITSADRYFYTDMLVMRNNYIFQDPTRELELIPYDNSDLFIPPIDVHANVLHFIAENNKVVSANTAFNLRSPHFVVKHNHIIVLGTREQRKAFSYSEADVKRGLIEGNEVSIPFSANGQLIYIFLTDETALIENMTIKDNVCDNAYITLSTANAYKNLVIEGNTLANCYSHGISISSATNVDGAVIRDNYIEYNTKLGGFGITTDILAFTKPIVISGNRFKNNGFDTSTDRHNIRIGTLNNHIITNNIIDRTIHDTTNTYIHPWKANTITSPLNTVWKGCIIKGDLLVRGGTPPSSHTWAVGDIVYNSSATAGGKVGWVCISAGTPGTWKAFGAIDA